MKMNNGGLWILQKWGAELPKVEKLMFNPTDLTSGFKGQKESGM